MRMQSFARSKRNDKKIMIERRGMDGGDSENHPQVHNVSVAVTAIFLAKFLAFSAH